MNLCANKSQFVSWHYGGCDRPSTRHSRPSHEIVREILGDQIFYSLGFTKRRASGVRWEERLE